MAGSIKSSRLIQLLAELSPREFRGFISLVDSPFFNTNERLVPLAEYLFEIYPGFDEDKLEKQKLYRVLYGKNSEYNEQQVYDHFSFLIRLLEEFFLQMAVGTSSGNRLHLLLRELSHRNLDIHFDRHYGKAVRKQEKQKVRGTDFFLHQYLLHREAVVLFGKQQKREQDDTLPKVVEALDLAFLASRLRFTCEIISRANILSEDPPKAVIEPIRTMVSGLPAYALDAPVIRGYYLVFQLLTEENETYYDELVALLKENTHRIPRDEITEMYTHAQNFCIKMINRGFADYHEHLFRLFQALLENGLLLEDGFMDHRKYKNIVTVGLRLRAFDWVKNFLHGYRNQLSPEFRENAFTYNLAAYHYELKEFGMAIPLLNQVSFTDVYYHLSAKAMMLKVYFEMEEDLALESLLDTFRIFLDRNRTISSYQRTIHKNLIKYTRKIHRLREKQGIIEKEDFQNQLQGLFDEVIKVQQIANINWLLGEIRNLQNHPEG